MYKQCLLLLESNELTSDYNGRYLNPREYSQDISLILSYLTLCRHKICHTIDIDMRINTGFD